MTEHPRRRAEDRDSDATQTQDPDQTSAGPERRRRRARDFFQRFRQPLIGLGLAGAATPMIRSSKHEGAGAEEQTSTTASAAGTGTDTASAATAETQTAPKQDLEERLATRIAETTAESEREAAVASALDRYGISRELAEDIYDIASEAGVEPSVAYGLVKTESTFNTHAVSNVGALGLTQLMPRTARWLKPGTRTEDLYDRRTNLRLGFTYLNQLVDRYRGDVKLALTAYNRGPGTVDRVLKRGGNPDNGYAGKVLGG